MQILDAIKNIFVNLFHMEVRRFQRFRNQSPRRKWQTYSHLILPVALFYYEIVFRLSTTGGIFRYGLILTLLFSICYGMAVYFLTTITNSPGINRWIKRILLLVIPFPYIVEYFVYRKFKTLYDLNTVLGGTGDVVGGGFMADAARMIFSLTGLFTILLFFLPFILYMVFGRHFDPAKGSNARRRIAMLARLIITFLLTLLLVAIPATYRNSYNAQYNFESAVPNFGFMTGVRLEVKKAFFGSKNSFEIMEMESTPSPSATATPAPEASPEPTIDRSPAVMDIDFNALAASAESETLAEIDRYVASLTPSSKNEYTGLFKGKNLIFLSAEAFSGYIIDEKLTPTLYRLANKGIQVPDFYQPEIAGTTGGEYHNLFGLITTAGGTSMEEVVDNYNPFILSRSLSNLGYWSAAYHNNDYDYYDRDYTHNNMGFTQGFMGYGNGMEQYVEDTWPESDLQMMEGTVPLYINEQPFYAYYMTVSGHSDYTTYDNMMSYRNWELVEDLPYSDRVRSYLAANMELEKAMTYLVEQLEQAGIADDTVIVLSADHFPYGLDDDASLPYLSELYGHPVNNLLERDHNRLIIWSGCLEDMDPIVVDTPVLSIDILPTLLNLFDLEWDSRLLPGRDILSDAEPLVFNNKYDWKTDKGTYIASTATFTPADTAETVSDDYVSRINSIVSNKISFCDSILKEDYYAHVFGR